MKKIYLGCLCALTLLMASCATTQHANTNVSSDIKFNILCFNDVYEITPVNGEGGLARVSTLYKQLKAENPNSLLMLAGDFFSPSALGTAKVDGKRLDGKQMVAVLNAMGVQYVTFGNHEFDVKEDVFKERMKEGKYKWISSNVVDTTLLPFPGVKPFEIVTFNQGSQSVRVGIFSVTLDANKAAYVRYTDYLNAAKEAAKILRPKVDVLIAMTHLAIEQDLTLAQQIPEIDLIMGGHEHENIIARRGIHMTPITKADANVKTVFVHRFGFNPETKKLTMSHDLVSINDKIAEDPEISNVVNHWLTLAYDGFKKEGFEPTRVAAKTTDPLDGLEVSVRNRSTTLTQLIANAMLNAVPNASCAIYNSGSIRIDDVLAPGNITEYDVIRIMPFGGEIVSVNIKGAVLKKVLTQGVANKGKGGYLQHTNISNNNGVWQIVGKNIEDNETYLVAMSDFLASGKERGLEFLSPENPDVKIVGKFGDVRKAFITQLKTVYSE
ncbi:MAG: bifunctional metallophosphatase/5'-nucleotidase [Spirosomataceae bacterium]